MRWSLVRKPKAQGGLGIKPIKAMNQALLAKWLCDAEIDNDLIFVIAESYRAQLEHPRWPARVPINSNGELGPKQSTSKAKMCFRDCFIITVNNRCCMQFSEIMKTKKAVTYSSFGPPI